MRKLLGPFGLALLLTMPLASVPSTSAQSTPCSADALQADVRSTLVGSIEVSSLRIVWQTANEGAELVGYEVWSRFNGRGVRLTAVEPMWMCPMPMNRVTLVPYDPRQSYWLELRLRDGTIRALPIPVR